MNLSALPLRLLAAASFCLLSTGRPAPLHAAPATAPQSPAAATDSATADPGAADLRPERTTVARPYLVPRNRSQHTLFIEAGYLVNLSTIHFKASDKGSLNEGLNLTAGYNWTSRRGLGAGVIYSGGFLSARRDGVARTARLHYVAPEFVARQRVGRRWLFREAVGIGYGYYVRTYGDNRAGRGGIGQHERASVEYMLTRWLGLSAGFSGQWLLVSAPDVGDGVELNLGGILTFHVGGGIRLYF